LLVARVLVVQPREALAHTTVRTLRGAGWEPIVVADGDAAVRLAVTDPPTAILVDLTLPALDGPRHRDLIAFHGARQFR